jgi:hypothetical protein
MTESEWLACTDPTPMLRFLESRSRLRWRASESEEQHEADIPGLLKREEPASRKPWLFCCACARRGEHLGVPDFALERQKGIEATERFLDGQVSEEEWWDTSVAHLDADYDPASTLAAHLFYVWASSFDAASDAADTIAREHWTHPHSDYEDYLRELPIEEQEAKRAAEKAARAALSGLVRCVFGNPFHPIALNPAWQTPTVVGIAQAAYDNRILPAGTLEPDRLTVLADGLEEAGCDIADILNHLRQSGDHVRGCWVIDLILSKDRGSNSP